MLYSARFYTLVYGRGGWHVYVSDEPLPIMSCAATQSPSEPRRRQSLTPSLPICIRLAYAVVQHACGPVIAQAFARPVGHHLQRCWQDSGLVLTQKTLYELLLMLAYQRLALHPEWN